MPEELTDFHEKPTRMRGDERREFILNRSKSVFARLGYTDASTGELARASEVTEPMLYKHFGSKKGLYLAVMKQYCTRFLQLWRVRVNRHAEEDLQEALAQVIMDYRAALKEDPEIQKVLMQSASNAHDPEIAQGLQIHGRKVYLIIHQLLEQAQMEGFVAADVDLNAATWGFLSMVLAMQYSLVLNLNDELNDDVISKMSTIWVRGLRASSE